MRLSQFIDDNTEAILSEWEAFARTLIPAAAGLDVAALRDHAEQILHAVALDLATAQSPDEQFAKSRGEMPRSARGSYSAAETHGLLRATGGFTLPQLIAEYRALRASVLKLWAASDRPGADALEDVMRFNEAIDQAIAESADFFARESERWRNVFLGVLGHDLRGPLNAILLTSRLLVQLNEGGPVSEVTGRIIRGGERMRQLLDDLLDYSRASLDLGIPIKPVETNLEQVCEEELELQRIAWPTNVMSLAIDGSAQGTWDPSRMKQVLGNLVTNAAKYGDARTPIDVRLDGTNDANVMLTVENAGVVAVSTGSHSLFEPLNRGAQSTGEIDRTSLGLGLFIVRQIVRAHGGEVSVASAAGSTEFKVVVPRHAPPSRTNGRA